MEDDFLSLMGFESIGSDKSIHCPCNGTMILVRSLKYQWRDGRYKLMYLCTLCGTKHGAHPDGRPLGIPTNDPVLKALRHECHVLLDQLSGTTLQKYHRLSQLMGVKELHFGSLDLDQCRLAHSYILVCIARDTTKRKREDRFRQETGGTATDNDV